MLNSQLPRGVFAAALTPQTQDFRIDYEKFIAHCFVSRLKQIMANFTGQQEWLNMRPPNASLNDEEAKVLEESLKSVNFTNNNIS